MPQTRVSIISPAYNEARTLPEFVRRTAAVMNKAVGAQWELIIVNDASTDDTRSVLDGLQKKYANLRPVHHRRNGGQTQGFASGFAHARGEIVITMDCDLEVVPEDIPLFLDRMRGSVDVVNGIRTNRKHTFAINFASRIYNILLFLFFKTLTYDSASNFTAFRGRLVRSLKLRYNDHRYIIPIVMRRGAREIDEVIIHHHYRKAGMSKYGAARKFILGFVEILYAWIRITLLGRYDLR